MSIIPINKKYDGRRDILLLDVFNKITKNIQINLPVDVTLGRYRASPFSCDTSFGDLLDLLTSVPGPFVHKSYTHILPVRRDSDGGRNVFVFVF